MNTTDAARLARALMNEHGIPQWTFRFDRAKRRFGVCKYRHEVIGLSVYLTRMNPESKVRDTILHEIAHAIAGHKAGHGIKWKGVCRIIGARPVRCFGSDVTKPKPKWIGTCPVCHATYPRLRVSSRILNASSCTRHGSRDYDERFTLTWRRA